ncbi:mannitol dehydrogenase family protein [Verminephrobacter eiseniae]|uniref:mannitol dehydrogenase family protein n=1 Tax=Verminephrobacter eiseniae TaxID=364317 RepID=UPI002237CC3E|nr:mannitol dehydrogenase family protein [Verminephrobacter eiseniae]MCW5237750.1 mannitol dehydrogenase family protein [Verminephrobacter eiseniae]
MQTLSPCTLARLPASVARPGYDRDALKTGIVHLGLGAFPRAHLAAVNEAALHASGDLRWGIAGVSLRSPGTRDALAPQGGLYTLALRDIDDSGTPRTALQVIGCLRQCLVAAEDPAAVIALIAHPDTRILSLTVTEKGYCHDPASGALQVHHPQVQHDLAALDRPRSTLGFIVAGLRQRRRLGLAPVTLLSLDNLPSNGQLLRALVLDFAARIDPALAEWIAGRCSFPCSMVDRIVPRTTDDDRALVRAALGVEDAWPVVGERFLDWVLEDRFVAGRPAWERSGARLAQAAQPFETLKLRMVNASHSALAYLGLMAGFQTVDQAIAQPALRRYLERLMTEEIAPTLPALAGLDLHAYRERLLARFANPALAHRTAQIALDGSQKLPQRLLGTVRDRLAAGASIELLALAVAAWLHHLRGRDEQAQPYRIHDPQADALAQQHALADAAAAAASDAATTPAHQATSTWVRAFIGLAPVFGTDLQHSQPFVHAVAAQLHALRTRGVLPTLEGLA